MIFLSIGVRVGRPRKEVFSIRRLDTSVANENRLEKSFNDSAKECEKPADTFPRDRPKAVPKRPNNKTNRRGAHGRRSRVLDQNMRRTDSTRRAGNGGQRVASFCSSAAAFLPHCAVIAASATSRDRASTPVSATRAPRIDHLPTLASPIAEISQRPFTTTKGGPPKNPNNKRFQLNATQTDPNLNDQKNASKKRGLN